MINSYSSRQSQYQNNGGYKPAEAITSKNINYIRTQIDKKNKSFPYYAFQDTISNVIEDLDHFPYTRFYRGQAKADKPIVFEREAGYRQQHDKCYKPLIKAKSAPKPSHCFEGPCSVVYPCYPQYLRKYADKNELEVMLNKVCVIKSP